MIKQYKLRFYNFKLVILLTAISLFGVQLVASASPDLRNKQLLGVVMGLVLLVILSLMDYSWILNFQWIMYGFNLLMLIGVRLFGSEAGVPGYLFKSDGSASGRPCDVDYSDYYLICRTAEVYYCRCCCRSSKILMNV